MTVLSWFDFPAFSPGLIMKDLSIDYFEMARID
jgi:hypothetical protein